MAADDAKQAAERQRWQVPLAGYKRERALQAQRARQLEAVERALQKRASASALAQSFVKGALAAHLQLACFRFLSLTHDILIRSLL